MKVSIKCFPPNVSVRMDDDKIIMRYTLNVTSQVWEKLNKKFPGHCIKGPKRYLFGNAIYLKSLDARTVSAAYRYLRDLTMVRIRVVKLEKLNDEVTNLTFNAIKAKSMLKETANCLNYDPRLQE